MLLQRGIEMVSTASSSCGGAVLIDVQDGARSSAVVDHSAAPTVWPHWLVPAPANGTLRCAMSIAAATS
jgi:hypothetical protein